MIKSEVNRFTHILINFHSFNNRFGTRHVYALVPRGMERKIIKQGKEWGLLCIPKLETEDQNDACRLEHLLVVNEGSQQMG